MASEMPHASRVGEPDVRLRDGDDPMPASVAVGEKAGYSSPRARGGDAAIRNRRRAPLQGLRWRARRARQRAVACWVPVGGGGRGRCSLRDGRTRIWRVINQFRQGMFAPFASSSQEEEEEEEECLGEDLRKSTDFDLFSLETSDRQTCAKRLGGRILGDRRDGRRRPRSRISCCSFHLIGSRSISQSSVFVRHVRSGRYASSYCFRRRPARQQHRLASLGRRAHHRHPRHCRRPPPLLRPHQGPHPAQSRRLADRRRIGMPDSFGVMYTTSH